MSAESLSPTAPSGPHLILEVLSHAAELRRFVLAPGGVARVGRTALADFVVTGDEQLSGAHFALEWDGVTATIRDLESAGGTQVGGVTAAAAGLRHGEWVRAGHTDFRVYHEGYSRGRARAAAGGSLTSPGPALEVLQGRLGAGGGHLYAVLDAARSPRVLELLSESVDEQQSLFDGLGGASLSRVAPYLVKLAPATSGLLGSLLAEGWGQSWGVYLLSSFPFREVRRHLRRHLKVEDPDNRPLYFRLYDPRVLRRFLPMASARQVQELFADVVGRYLAEGRLAGEMHLFGQSAPGVLHQETVWLGSGPAAGEKAR